MKISILHPSRQRPERSQETLRKWISRAAFPDKIEVIISVDNNDHKLQGYVDNHLQDGGIFLCYDNRSAVDAINRAASVANGDIFIVVSDDTDCPELWDAKLLDEVHGKEDWILKCQDGIQPWLITMPVMDRAYYNRFGYIYHPDYSHMFVDTELSCVADLTGRRLTSNLKFPHNHYSVTKAAEKDAVSIKADATWKQGENLFISRYKKGFDLTDAPGSITDQSYINWIKKRL